MPIRCTINHSERLVDAVLDGEISQEDTTQFFDAIEAAVAWLKSVQIKGLRLEQRQDPSLPEGRDVVAVQDPAASPLWARFYEIGTNRPIFSGRDGVIRYSLAEIEHERRIGYAWLGTWPARLLDSEYPSWKKNR